MHTELSRHSRHRPDHPRDRIEVGSRSSPRGRRTCTARPDNGSSAPPDWSSRARPLSCLHVRSRGRNPRSDRMDHRSALVVPQVPVLRQTCIDSALRDPHRRAHIDELAEFWGSGRRTGCWAHGRTSGTRRAAPVVVVGTGRADRTGPVRRFPQPVGRVEPAGLGIGGGLRQVVPRDRDRVVARRVTLRPRSDCRSS